MMSTKPAAAQGLLSSMVPFLCIQAMVFVFMSMAAM